MKITWFGHSCFRIDTGSSSILIDPFLSFNPTFANSGLSLHQAIKGVTHVALTHGHEDHSGDTVTIGKETGAPLLAVRELATYLAGQGVEKIDPGNTGGTLYHKDFDLTFVPAWHSASHMVDPRPIYSRRLLRARHHAQAAQDGLPHGRHGDLLRHGLDR